MSLFVWKGGQKIPEAHCMRKEVSILAVPVHLLTKRNYKGKSLWTLFTRFLLQALVLARPHWELQILEEFWCTVLYHQDPKVANLAEWKMCWYDTHLYWNLHKTKWECHKGTTCKSSQSQLRFWVQLPLFLITLMVNWKEDLWKKISKTLTSIG